MGDDELGVVVEDAVAGMVEHVEEGPLGADVAAGLVLGHLGRQLLVVVVKAVSWVLDEVVDEDFPFLGGEDTMQGGLAEVLVLGQGVARDGAEAPVVQVRGDGLQDGVRALDRDDTSGRGEGVEDVRELGDEADVGVVGLLLERGCVAAEEVTLEVAFLVQVSVGVGGHIREESVEGVDVVVADELVEVVAGEGADTAVAELR